MKNAFSTLICAALLTALFAAGCVETRYVYVDQEAPVAATPAYVHVYASGGCWADDVWYGACPWHYGPGYWEWHHDAVYVFRPGVVWVYRPGHPPPRYWHHHPPPHHRPPARRR